MSERIVFTVTLGELAEVPGSPFAYWAPESLRRLFKEYPPLDRDVAGMPDKEKIADVKVGLQTSDDLRFTRFWWEVPVEQIAASREETRRGKKWVPFAKGGRPFYHDVALLVNWGNDGEEIRSFHKAVIRNESFYFRPGLAWALIAKSQEHGFDMFLKPSGTMHDVASHSIFLDELETIGPLLATLNSVLLWKCFILLEPTAHNRHIGYVAKLPISPAVLESMNLSTFGREAHDLLREWTTGEETATVFVAPWILQVWLRRQGKTDADLMPTTGHPLARDFAWSDWASARAIRQALAEGPAAPVSLRALAEACVRWQSSLQARLAEIQRQLDDEIYRLYGISDEDRSLIEAELGRVEEADEEEEEQEHEGEEEHIRAHEVEQEEGPPEGVLPRGEHVRRLVHYLAHQVIQEDPDGIVPLYDCYPVGASEVERGLIYRVREKLKELFGPNALPRVEREIQEVLARPLDEWLATDFFGYHAGLYRLRPIILQIVPPAERARGRRSSATGAGLPFSVFLYWPRLDTDTLRKVRAVYLQSYLDAGSAEVSSAERKLSELRASGAARPQQTAAERGLEAARARYEALRSLADRLDGLLRSHTLQVQSRSEWVKEKAREIVTQGYRPVRDYGVRVNIEPLKQAGILPRDAQRVRG
jgi:hypothetical protein